MINKCYCGKEFKTYPSKIKLGRGKYCSKECCLKITNQILSKNEKSRWKKGQVAYNFKGWRFKTSRTGGSVYRELYLPKHPFAKKSGYIGEHRLVMENKIERYLLKSEVVHHINGNTLDNRIENLELMTKKEHDKLKN
jgi:hypothetical protein